ncbi:MAG: tRNA epoxyqueuosine(34) reductase QueG [Pseudomonadota bacterium]
MLQLREQIRAFAQTLGFARVGFASTEPLLHNDFLQQWLDRGMGADMQFMSRSRHERAYPKSLLTSAQSAIVVVAQYCSCANDDVPDDHGKIARYARGKDYHLVLHQRLHDLENQIRTLVSTPFESKVIVDTAPLLERELAMAAGVGFIGKNTMLITPGVGSYTVIGTLLVSLQFPPDRRSTARCGRCDLCIKACPTKALAAPYLVDARNCVSYLTIEHRGPIPKHLGAKFGSWVFGCDDCQQICPFNSPTKHSPSPNTELCPNNAMASIKLSTLEKLRSGDYRRLVRARSLARTPRQSLIRNSIIISKTQWTQGPRSPLEDPPSNR